MYFKRKCKKLLHQLDTYFVDDICYLSINEIPLYCKIYCYIIHPSDDKAWSLLHCVHCDKVKILTYWTCMRKLCLCVSIAKISVYKHWRHFRSLAQSYWCVWLAEALSTWSNPLLADEFPTRFSQVSMLRFPLNFNSGALSQFSSIPPGFRMKCSVYVNRQLFEVREFSAISFVLIAFCQP